jgi:hypothetical protein
MVAELNMKVVRIACAVMCATAFTSISADAQDVHSDRFGLGISGISGSFGGYDAVLLGAEGFVRIARGSFWSARVNGAYYGGTGQGDKVCLVSGGNCGGADSRFIRSLSTLIATLSLGPTASNGLRPFYGLLGLGGVVIGSGGPSCSSFAPQCGPSEFLALDEVGVGSEFRALGGNRIELRVHSASRSLLFLSSGEHSAAGASLTIGVVW